MKSYKLKTINPSPKKRGRQVANEVALDSDILMIKKKRLQILCRRLYHKKTLEIFL